MPISRIAAPMRSGGTSSEIPSASSTSAEPHLDEIERLPCLATCTPAPAATNAAAVEMLNVPEASPPVPHVSTSNSSGRVRVIKNRRGVAAHGAREADQFPHRFALGAQRREEGDNRILRGEARKDFLHRGFGFLAR